MPLEPEIKILEEMKKINKEIETIKSYLSKMIEINLQQIEISKPTPQEERIAKEKIKRREFVKWDEVKDEI
ncbi:MAG: hypothetical protein ACP5H3_01150 [Candidatus Aenigmatarchaeota archaeon]|jgi:2C-methyl-D-erythritol 2,4-cyclodiphosphate synthase